MPFKWEKLTAKSQEAVQAAASNAAENGNPEILPLHLLAALLEDREGIVLPVLEGAGVPAQQLLAGVNSAISKLPKVQGGTQPGMSQALQKVFDRASNIFFFRSLLKPRSSGVASFLDLSCARRISSERSWRSASSACCVFAW